ncbi:hypothetical protein BGW42_006346 [Actinomortierella wolfii]|nr:hypothetical protein BGW42_006346 [Actinomortierella wolfii]
MTPDETKDHIDQVGQSSESIANNSNNDSSHSSSKHHHHHHSHHHHHHHNGSSSTADDASGDASMAVDKLSVNTLTPGGFSRLELVRLMVQALQSLGYSNSASLLEKESGFRFESPAITRFRECVLAGKWDEVEELVRELDLEPTTAAPTVQFLIREQKFLELLEARQIKNALLVLRTELTPLQQNTERVHVLTSYMMSSSPEDLRQRANWDGANGQSRRILLQELQKLIPPAVMVPENRLEKLLEQARELQTRDCVYHDARNSTYSLYSDHVCSKIGIPTVTRRILDNHTDEVWSISISHDGRYLASASKDSKVIVWSLETFEAVHILEGHRSRVSCVIWSPDDTRLLTADFEKEVKLWDVQSTSGEVKHSWSNVRVRDLAISEDGNTLVAVSGAIIQVINLEDKAEIVTLQETRPITCICLSKDGNHLLANTTVKPEQDPVPRDIHLWNLNEGRIVRKYSGHSQGRFVVRSCFGGYNERFVISGSEDFKVYIWHRENGNLIQVLEGHTRPVTVVAWSPTHPTLLVSGSDDHTIRIWGTPEDVEEDQRTPQARLMNGAN